MSELLSFFYSRKKIESHKKVYQNKTFCNIIKHSEDTRILQFNQYQKPDKRQFIIYVDLQGSIEKVDGYKNNPKHLSTTKVGKHISSTFTISTTSSFKSVENKHDAYRDKDCMKRFYKSLRGHAMEIINFEKKKNEVINKRVAGII